MFKIEHCKLFKLFNHIFKKNKNIKNKEIKYIHTCKKNISPYHNTRLCIYD